MSYYKLIELSEILKKQVEENLKLAYENGFADGKASVDEPKFKTEKRAAEVGERILVVNPVNAEGQYKCGSIGTVRRVNGSGVWVNEWSNGVFNREYEVITEENDTIEHDGLLLQKVRREAREGDFVKMTAGTNSLSILQNVVYGPVTSKLEVKDSFGKMREVYDFSYGRNKETIEVFEVVNEVGEAVELAFAKVPTPNEQRAALIERAKGFVKKYEAVRSGDASHDVGNETATECYYETLFYTKGRRVTAVVYPLIWGDKKQNSPSDIGRARCHSNEVFNEHIGKAIALARALKIDVPEEFLNAVQPNKRVVGMKVYHSFHKEVVILVNELSEPFSTQFKGEAEVYSVYAEDSTIIDDTNAIYVQGE